MKKVPVFGQNNLESLSPEAKYWCGFIGGDGHVTASGGVVFNLSWLDHEHLDTFADFVGSNKRSTEVFVKHDLIWGDGHMARLSIGCRILGKGLPLLGMTPRKCKTDFVVSEHLAMSRDFWRGMLDADGSVALWKNHGKLFPNIALHQAGKRVMDQFSEYILKISGYVFKPQHYDGWTIAINGNKARDLINHIYYDGCVALPRKLTSAEECKKWKGIREQNRDRGYISIRSTIKKTDIYKYALKTFSDP